MLAASINYPLRGAVTWKSTVGTNVASDALSNLASAGVRGGALMIVGEDYGEGASIMQERTHAFAMKSQMWLLDPRPDTTVLVDMVERGFELSEASHTPVMLMLRIRACHMHGSFIAKANVAPRFSIQDALDNPQRSAARIILPPATYVQEQEKVLDRWPAAVRFIIDNGLNEMHEGDLSDVGIVMQGGLYNTVLRSLEFVGAGGYFRENAHSALRPQRHLSSRSKGIHPIRGRQARVADRGGGSAGIHRAERQSIPAQRRSSNAGHRQRSSAYGGRIHRCRCERGNQSVPRGMGAAFTHGARFRGVVRAAIRTTLGAAR